MKKTLSIFLMFMFIVTGCYTVIKHPVITNKENTNLKRDIYFSDNCTSCHDMTAANFSHTDQQNLPRLDYIHENNRWHHYYENPWWYRSLFYEYSGSGNNTSGDGPLPTTSARPRFPGAGNNNSSHTNTSITGGNSSSTGSNTRIVGGNNQSSTSGNSAVRGQSNNSNVRKAVRGSGKSKSDSGNSDKVNRRKKKE